MIPNTNLQIIRIAFAFCRVFVMSKRLSMPTLSVCSVERVVPLNLKKYPEVKRVEQVYTCCRAPLVD